MCIRTLEVHFMSIRNIEVVFSHQREVILQFLSGIWSPFLMVLFCSFRNKKRNEETKSHITEDTQTKDY